MKVELICKVCGYKEKGETHSMLMIKIRMLNHIHDKHPEVTGPAYSYELLHE